MAFKPRISILLIGSAKIEVGTDNGYLLGFNTGGLLALARRDNGANNIFWTAPSAFENDVNYKVRVIRTPEG